MRWPARFTKKIRFVTLSAVLLLVAWKLNPQGESIPHDSVRASSPVGIQDAAPTPEADSRVEDTGLTEGNLTQSALECLKPRSQRLREWLTDSEWSLGSVEDLGKVAESAGAEVVEELTNIHYLDQGREYRLQIRPLSGVAAGDRAIFYSVGPDGLPDPIPAPSEVDSRDPQSALAWVNGKQILKRLLRRAVQLPDGAALEYRSENLKVTELQIRDLASDSSRSFACASSLSEKRWSCRCLSMESK